MSDDEGITTLPQEVWDALESAYQAYHEANQAQAKDRDKKAVRLAVLAAAGRKAGWPVRALAEPTGVSAERLRQIIRDRAAGKPLPRSPKFPKYSPPRAKKERPKKIQRSHLTEEERAELEELAILARQNTGSRPLNSPYRRASERFSALIIKYHKRGVIWGEMAEATGHKISGLRMRAARHGYGSGAPPSIAPYRRMVIHGKHKEVKPPQKAAAKKKTTTAKKTTSKKRKSA